MDVNRKKRYKRKFPKHYFQIVSVVVFLFPLVSFAVTANITQLVFTTEQQQVEPNTLSKVITVQTQNSSGASEDVDETNNVEFTSTSASAEFLNDKGAAVLKTMSKNTASRNFYYRDSAVGEATITVKITGRTSGKSFSASQKIVIGAGSATSGSDSDATGTSSSGTSSTSNTTSASGSGGSVSGSGSYSSYASATNVPEEPPFEIGAGRARTTTVGSFVQFAVQASPKSDISGGRFVWSFGDGTQGEGYKTSHAYVFPGDYVVILNGDRNGKEAVSKTTVSVSIPNLSGKSVLGGIEIANGSNTEINIGEWYVSNQSTVRQIPRDTIILPRRSIVIPQSAFGTDFFAAALLDSLKNPRIVFGGNSVSVTSPIAKNPSIISELEVAQAKLDILKQTLLALQQTKNKNESVTKKSLQNSAAIIGTEGVSLEKKKSKTSSLTPSTFFDRIQYLFQTP